MLDLGVPIEQVNYLAGHKSMAMTKRYDHANEERYGAAIEALDAAGKTGSAEALAAARCAPTYPNCASLRRTERHPPSLPANPPIPQGTRPTLACGR
jgi:hypothetical protein